MQCFIYNWTSYVVNTLLFNTPVRKYTRVQFTLIPTPNLHITLF